MFNVFYTYILTPTNTLQKYAESFGKYKGIRAGSLLLV